MSNLFYYLYSVFVYSYKVRAFFNYIKSKVGSLFYWLYSVFVYSRKEHPKLKRIFNLGENG